MRKLLICDTMFYYNPCMSIVDSQDFDIVGTYMNAWELITSNKFNEAYFQFLQKAISNFLDLPFSYEGINPFTVMIDRKVSPVMLKKDAFEWDYILEILDGIRKAKDYQSFTNKEGASKLAEHDHTARKDVASMYSHDFTMFRKKYAPQKRIMTLLSDKETLRYEVIKDFNGIVKTMIERDYSRIITSSMVNWGTRSFLEQALLGFNYVYLSGSRGTTKDGVKVDPNDLNDLFQMVYVDQHSYFYTEEKLWKNICLEHPELSKRFVTCVNSG